MVRAKTLVTLFSACLVVGDGFVHLASKVTSKESPQPKKQATQLPTRFVAPPVGVGGIGLGTASAALSWGEVVANTQASLIRVPSAVEHAGRCRRRGCLTRLHAINSREMEVSLFLIFMTDLKYKSHLVFHMKNNVHYIYVHIGRVYGITSCL